MDGNTCYAPTYRLVEDDLRLAIGFVERSPVATAILKSVGGKGVIIGKHRQILGATDGFRAMVGAETLDDLLGLRVGEAVKCVNCTKGPAGCGTTPWCSTCGAVIAMMTAQSRNEPVSRPCVLQVHDGEEVVTRCFNIYCAPVVGDGPSIYLLHLKETSGEHVVPSQSQFWKRLQGLTKAVSKLSRHLEDHSCRDPVVRLLIGMVGDLDREVTSQMIAMTESVASDDAGEEFPVHDLMESLREECEEHSSFRGRRLCFVERPGMGLLRGKRQLIHIVLRNMVVNALEASQEGESVVVEAEHGHEGNVFRVTNKECIPPHFALRIFQKHYTTKDGPGRGTGTWMMKLLGEQILGGEVGFTSDEESGTRFFLKLPAPKMETIQEAPKES